MTRALLVCARIRRMDSSKANNPVRARLWRWLPYALGTAALAALLALTIAVTGRKSTNNTESALWTFILFAIGSGLSFYFGRKSIKDAAIELVRPQARGAARRLVTLGFGVAGFRPLIERHRKAAQGEARDAGCVPLSHVQLAYDVLLAHMETQILTISDALEDWREFEPEIVNKLETELQYERADETDDSWEF